jgi:hypothetical protein
MLSANVVTTGTEKRNEYIDVNRLVTGKKSDKKARFGFGLYAPANSKQCVTAPVITRLQQQQLEKSAMLVAKGKFPETFDWRNVDDVRDKRHIQPVDLTSVVNQHGCGSCWALAAAGELSDRYAIFNDAPNPNLSYTYILACTKLPKAADPKDHHNVCDGGSVGDAAKFLEHKGIPSFKCYDASWICPTGQACSEQSLPIMPPPPCDEQCHHNCQGKDKCEKTGKFKLFKARPGSTRYLADQASIKYDIYLNGPVAATYRMFSDFVIGTSPLYADADDWAHTRGIYVHIPNLKVYPYKKVGVNPQNILGCCLGKKGTREPCCLNARGEMISCFEVEGENIRGQYWVDPHHYYLGNHSIVIVGWGVEKNFTLRDHKGHKQFTLDLPYWICRNSWGPHWQERGHFKIAMSIPAYNINTHLYLDRMGVSKDPCNPYCEYIGGAISFFPYHGPEWAPGVPLGTHPDTDKAPQAPQARPPSPPPAPTVAPLVKSKDSEPQPQLTETDSATATSSPPPGPPTPTPILQHVVGQVASGDLPTSSIPLSEAKVMDIFKPEAPPQQATPPEPAPSKEAVGAKLTELSPVSSPTPSPAIGIFRVTPAPAVPDDYVHEPLWLPIGVVAFVSVLVLFAVYLAQRDPNTM